MCAVRESFSWRDRFVRDEDGTVAVEFVLWIPIIVALLATAIDAAALYITHTEMTNVARDTARRMVTGVIRSKSEAEAYAVKAMNLRDLNYGVEAIYDKDNTVEVWIGIQFSDMSIVGYGSPLAIFGTTIAAHAVMRPDPRLPFKFDDGGGGGGGNK